MSFLVHILPAIGFVLKDGAGSANFVWIGGVVTVVCFLTFVAWTLYAFLARRSEMDAAANLPFDLDEDDGGAA